ncbi:hypothetical protein ABZ845_30820 [Streptomyces sp. NPDC047022]|uniref:hypothetical protein n=1 Tax=Streptomyces sp. NPDC047022 TaxID=3155737 RepID=UPI0033E9E838
MSRFTRAHGATLGLLVPALMALGMSADTSYRYMGLALHITAPIERAALCGVAEAAIIALTLYAWATSTRTAAYLAYAAVLIQAVPAFRVSGDSGGLIRVALGPVLLALLLHLLLGLELRMTGARSDSLMSQAARELRERLTARLGIGARGADSAAIARSRAADRAVRLAGAANLSPRSTRRSERRNKALAQALDAARHGLDGDAADAAEAAIVARVVRLKSAAHLADIAVRHDWNAVLYADMQSSALPAPNGALARLGEARRRALWGIRPVIPPRPDADPAVETTHGPAEEHAAQDVYGYEANEHQDQEHEGSADPVSYAAMLLAHEPPHWAGMTVRQAVARADELIPEVKPAVLAQALALVGVETTAGSIRSTRSALRNAKRKEPLTQG